MTKKLFVNFALCLTVVLFLSGTVRAEDRRIDKSSLVIMTFNAEFMWDGVAPEEGQVNFAWKNSQTEAEERMQKIAEIIIRSNPDVVNMVEVENLAALNTLNNKFLQGRGYKAYLVDGKDNFTGQDVGLLTRIDPENNQIRRDDRKGQSGNVSKSVSKNYIARIQAGDTKLAFIGLHFLAQPNREDRRLDRQAQADAVRMIAVEELTAGFAPVVLGDFNDFDGEADVLDLQGSLPISRVLQNIRSMDFILPDDDLVNAAKFVSQPLRYTAFWDQNDNNQINAPQEFSSIDHILLAATLAGRIESVQMPHDHNPLEVSDHFPVVVKLRLTGNGGTTTTASNGIRITAIVPNPTGNENQEEAVTVKNISTQSINMTGWKLRDLAGKMWQLDSLGTITPNQEKQIKRRGQLMALNNNGDTVDLINLSGTVVQTVTYARADEDEIIVPVN